MESIFALDIGTRVVIGLIMEKSERGYEILASARTEHTQRAMYDGQVHDVDEVARAVLRIKEELEAKTGKTYKQVAVAAAGRALTTTTEKASREEALPIRWEKEEVLAMEMEAVQKAMKKNWTKEKDNSSFYCVGYSTVNYLLEGQPISSLIGQRGKKAELTVIATFLPRTVVDGLSAVLARTGLEMSSLTLEPIAAGQAAIPADMRRMNLALVDIGAGTADIALTKGGTFFAYGMVPMAGDEVTEAICSHYLLDFQEGEKIKRELIDRDEVEIINFFGEKTVVTKPEILDIIQPTVAVMAGRIAQEILLLNNEKPQAIILVGGGSLTPLLGDILSETIGLPRNRLGIQVRERINQVFGEEDNLKGSDVVTPIGIGMASLDGKGLHYYSVNVNNNSVPLFELQLATVAEALLAAGIQPKSFLGRPGAALIYELNGTVNVCKGELGTPAEITVNGKPARLEQQLHPADRVSFVPGFQGKDARAQIKDIVSVPEKKMIFWNGRQEELKPFILLNGKPAQETTWLEDGCKVTVRNTEKLSELLKNHGFSLDKVKKKLILVNGVKRELASGLEVTVNGQPVTGDCLLRNNDHIDVVEKNILIKDLELQAEPMSFTVNDQDFQLPAKETKIFSKGEELRPEDMITDDMEIRVEGFGRKPILSELFPYLNLMEKAIPGGKLEMLVNGIKAEFTTELKQGDRIVIRWLDSVWE